MKVRHRNLVNRVRISVSKDQWYVQLVVITIQWFPRVWLNTGFTTKVARQMPHVEQEPLTLPEHMSYSLVFSGVCVDLLFTVDHCLSCCPFFFCILSPSIYGLDYSFCILSPSIYGLDYSFCVLSPSIYGLDYSFCILSPSIYGLDYSFCILSPSIYGLDYSFCILSPIYGLDYSFCILSPSIYGLDSLPSFISLDKAVSEDKLF